MTSSIARQLRRRFDDFGAVAKSGALDGSGQDISAQTFRPIDGRQALQAA
jgi:hypothetical protein